MGSDFSPLMRYYPNEFAKALVRTKEVEQRAADEWRLFTHTWFGKQGRPLPDWQPYIEIQEGLGIRDKGKIASLLRSVHKATQRRLYVVYGWLSNQFPDSQWLSRKKCYYTALFSEQYELLSGKYSCLE
jgi:hypothetical protein